MIERWIKHSIFVLGLMALVLALATNSTFARPVFNDDEIEVSGGFFHAKGSGTGALNLDASYGYYLSPDWQVGLRQAVNVNFIDDARDVWTDKTVQQMS